MTYVSQDNQNLLWELIAESNLLHTVSDRIPMVQQQLQSILMKYQFQTMNLTEKNKLTIREMVQYIKSFQDKKDTSESMQQERIETLQQTMNAHEAHFKEFNQPKKVEEIDFSDPKPDPSTFTPIEQILDNKQLERSADNKIDTVLKEIQEIKSIMLDIQTKLNEEKY
tara:strand:- start:93 stop:596 length:504 start_codon:yes stop_codon:yes gene_type:complete